MGALKAKYRAVAIVYFQIDFFVNLTEHLPPLHQGMPPLSVPYKFLTVFDIETYRSLSSLQVSEAVGPAGNIPKRLFKNFEPELALIIRDIYKQSLREGYIPSLIKSSIVSPLPKVIPPRAIESDLRPISLTCTLVKVTEGFTCRRLIPLLFIYLINQVSDLQLQS